MAKKHKALIISAIVLVVIAVILIFSPILKSKPIAIEPGTTYQDTILPEDAPDITDKDYRRHTYSLNVAVDETYKFAVSSLSRDVIVVYEYYKDAKTQIILVASLESGTADHTFRSAGQKRIFVEALADECPADYSLRVTKVADSSGE